MESLKTQLSPDRLKEKENKLVFSYMTLRNFIGFSGMFLPILLILATKTSPGDLPIESSISDYYYTSSGDILVSVLCAMGAFLFTYRGYSTKENILSTIASVCGIGVAFSPTATKYLRDSFSVHTFLPDVPKIMGIERHLIFAGIFFITLSLISLICFPLTDAPQEKKLKRTQKQKRNIVYKICGWIMLICVAIMVIYIVTNKFSSLFDDFPFIFTMETIAIEAFAVSWLTKGETIYPDGEHYLFTGYKIARESIVNTLKK